MGGGGLGAGAGALSGALGRGDNESLLGAVLSRGAAGAALGAGAGGLGVAGLDLLTGGRTMPGEDDRGFRPIGVTADAAASAAISHAPTLTGAGVGAGHGDLGEDFFRQLMRELPKAKKFIFLEYFILEKGLMWDSVLEILRERAAAGVEVCVIYDDFGCIQRLSASYPKELAGFNIKAVPYNPMRPSMDPSLNYRDHRKICVIDGQVGFTGGINLADEYINKVERFGHWKDTSVLLRGAAVRSLTRMFLQQWTLNAGSDTLDRPEEEYLTARALPALGYVQPFPDSPLDHFNVAENAYLHLIQRADHYVYITTPYLILDNEFVTTLKTAAESGVDVRIITPSHPDKWYVHMVSRSYYQTLIQSGVKIYEYQPGFIHAKMCLCDDEAAMVGTANLDYRSLYLHYENAVLLYHTPVLAEIKKDIEETLEKSRLITIEELRSKLRGTSALCALLKLLAPLM